MINQITTLIEEIHIASSVITTWAIIVFIFILSLGVNNKLLVKPNGLQSSLEGVITVMQNAMEAVLPNHAELIFPFIATLWIFIFIANIVGVVPGLTSPTADLSVTAALAVVVFFSVHWFGIRAEGCLSVCTDLEAPLDADKEVLGLYGNFSCA